MPADYSFLDKAAYAPGGADFAFIMDNDDMAPYIFPGERVWVSRESPEEGQPGLFLYRGRLYCRQWCMDYMGDMHLLCANPKKEKENIIVPKAGLDEYSCLGSVLLKEKLPMPFYG